MYIYIYIHNLNPKGYMRTPRDILTLNPLGISRGEGLIGYVYIISVYIYCRGVYEDSRDMLSLTPKP